MPVAQMLNPGPCLKTLSEVTGNTQIYSITLPIDSTTPVTYDISCNSMFKYICLVAAVSSDNYSIKLSNFEELKATPDPNNNIPYSRGCVKQGFHRIYLKYTGIDNGIGSITISKNRSLTDSILYSNWSPVKNNDYFIPTDIRNTNIKLRADKIYNYVYFTTNGLIVGVDEKFKFILTVNSDISSNPPLPQGNHAAGSCGYHDSQVKIVRCGAILSGLGRGEDQNDNYTSCLVYGDAGVNDCIFYVVLQINPEYCQSYGNKKEYILSITPTIEVVDKGEGGA